MQLTHAITVQSQVNLEWAVCYDGPASGADYSNAIFVDSLGYVYITGASSESSSFNPNYATVKYDPNGTRLWSQRYGQSNIFQVGRALTVDRQGNVYVTGNHTLKYDSAGTLLWEVSNDAVCYQIIPDNNGNFYMGGTGYGDMRLLKISSQGDIIWQQLYDGSANYLDDFSDMVMDSEGQIIVTGRSHGIGTHWDYVTIKYSTDGDSLWVRRYNGPCHLSPGDYPYAITVDVEDNVYVTGWSDGEGSCNPQCFTIAYSSSGDFLWEHRYDPTAFAGYDILYSDGYIYVIAMSSLYAVINLLKYNKQGELVGIIPGLVYGSVIHIPRLATDNKGYIYLSGVRSYSYTVSKILPNPFSILWEYQYPGLFTSPGSFPRAMTVDKNDNIYLTGDSYYSSICPGGHPNYLTIKISQDKVNIDPQSEIVTQYELFQNYPNPFNPVTTIRFALPKREFVELSVYDLLGREIKTLLMEERSQGIHNINWNAEGVASGVYYYRITAGEFTQTRKLILLR